MVEPLTDPSVSVEYCDGCRQETRHSVSITIREEASEGAYVSSSREPYRITVCEECETATALRMNNQ